MRRRLKTTTILLCLLAGVTLAAGCSVMPASGTTLPAPASSPPVTGPSGNLPAATQADWRGSQWHIGDLTVQPDALRAGQAAEVRANIYVPGIVERYGNAYFSVNGQLVATVKDILIYGDEIIHVVFSFVPDKPGTYELRFGAILQDNGPYTPGPGDLLYFISVT